MWLSQMLCRLKWRTVRGHNQTWTKLKMTNSRCYTAPLQTSSGSWRLWFLRRRKWTPPASVVPPLWPSSQQGSKSAALFEIKIFLHIHSVNIPSPNCPPGNCFLTPDGDKVSTTCSNFRPAASQETLWWKQGHTWQLGADLCLKRVRPSAGGPLLEPLSLKASTPTEGPLCKALNSYQLLGGSSESRIQPWPLTRHQ